MIEGIGNFAQTTALRAPAQDNVSLDQQNTANQRAVQNGTQPFEAELAQTIQSENNPSSQSFAQNEESRFDIAAAEDFGNDAPRGSIVDVVV